MRLIIDYNEENQDKKVIKKPGREGTANGISRFGGVSLLPCLGLLLLLSLPSHGSPRPRLLVPLKWDRAHEKPPLRLHSTLIPSTSSSFLLCNSQNHPHPTLPFLPTTDQSVAAIILGDGPAESRGLYPLTKRRSEGAIPIAAKYRLIDAVVSNCINSNIHRIYALTQFNSTSLNSHFSRAYSGASALIQVIAASQSPDHNQWFQGSADAVRRCLWIVEEEGPVSEFLVLPSHHLYRMDYQKLITAHRNNKADITLAASFDRMNPDPGFGFLQLNSKNQVVEFSLKSEAPGKMSDTGSNGLKSMGIYLINKDTMKKLVQEDFPDANDLKSEVIPGAVSIGMTVQGYIFGGYWEDMRSIEAFYQANMETTKSTAMGYNFFDREMAMYTLAQSLPPTLITDAVITDSLIGDGCIINRCKIKGAVIGTRSRVGEGAVIEDSVILGSDSYQAEEGNDDEIPIGIGKQTQIRKAIIDKNARIGNNVMIFNKDKVEEGDREANGYVIRDGIVVVLRSAAIPHATII